MRHFKQCTTRRQLLLVLTGEGTFRGHKVANFTGQAKQEQNRRRLFRRRMHDQCGKIEQYRQAVLLQEGRSLSSDEAAIEWVERYAEDFARRCDGA